MALASRSSNMITLGLNAAFHDSAASLVVDGVAVAAAEEERFTRIKHAKRPVPFTAWELPFHAIDFCLAHAGVQLADVDHVAYSFDPARFIGDRFNGIGRLTLPIEPSSQSAGDWENPWDPLFAAYMLNAPRQLADGAPLHLRSRLGGVKAASAPYRWHFIDHHLCHQASAFLAAPLARCAVMTIDGRGERATTSYGRHVEGRYESLGEVTMPHSLGLLYERVTQHLGFLHSSDEYKVMALAALGEPRHIGVFRDHLSVATEGQFRVAPMDMAALFGPARVPGSPMTQQHFDLAASLQCALEETVLALSRWLRAASGEKHLAMAGGVALNCVMNARLRDSGIFDSVWVQPAAGDAGTALGAALWVDSRQRLGATAVPPSAPPSPSSGEERGNVTALSPRPWTMDHAYLGPAFDDAAIERLLQWAGLSYRRAGDLSGETAQLLADNRMIGWFQGRMEFGPRALGARSILASPIDPAMQARLNDLKDREDFRPVAPAVPEEEFARWFSPCDVNGGKSPFMLFVYDALPGQRERIPSACHADGTARVQTVSEGTHPQFHALLQAFGRRTGVPVLVNTSFNVRGQPIVACPQAAIEAFFSTPLDALVIGSFIVEKAHKAT